MLVTHRPQSDPKLRGRLDPDFWHPDYERVLDECVLPLVSLGEFLTLITYGPIVTGREPSASAGGQLDLGFGGAEDIPVVDQGQVGDCGVDLRGARRVPEGSPWDHPRARLQCGDIVFPRSGVGSVARNRVAVFLQRGPALVGSFVDRLQLTGIDPVYVLLCLRSELVWSQIHRITNGVGTPNISFDEIRSLRIPWLPEGPGGTVGTPTTQQDFRQAFLQQVHPLHLRYLEGDVEAQTQASEALSSVLRALNSLVFGRRDRKMAD
ncbi:hypothetical protein LLH03_07645 [bacterium]|nr:hypothetical protein [bacterium]